MQRSTDTVYGFASRTLTQNMLQLLSLKFLTDSQEKVLLQKFQDTQASIAKQINLLTNPKFQNLSSA